MVEIHFKTLCFLHFNQKRVSSQSFVDPYLHPNLLWLFLSWIGGEKLTQMLDSSKRKKQWIYLQWIIWRIYTVHWLRAGQDQSLLKHIVNFHIVWQTQTNRHRFDDGLTHKQPDEPGSQFLGLSPQRNVPGGQPHLLPRRSANRLFWSAVLRTADLVAHQACWQCLMWCWTDGTTNSPSIIERSGGW